MAPETTSCPPEGFEGSLSVEGLQEEQDFQNYVTVFENFGGILELQRIWRRLPSTEDVFLMSLTANVKDAGVWSQKVKTYKLLDEEWRQHQLDVQRKLKKESEIFGDILFIDVIDVYRNLPKKLLHFHKWVYDEMKVDFVLKTDDDCYVDLEKVVSTLKKDENQLLDKLIWWGSFREQWLVETHGKWAELDYAVDVYPRFACGGGNVVSQQIHQWLAENRAHLHSFQGEDVSMGIWLASLAVEFVHDKNWRCSKECDINMYSMPQLSPRELKQMWARRQQCHNPCSCSEKPDSNNN